MKKYSDLPMKEIIDDYRKGMTYKELSDKYGPCGRTIMRRINEIIDVKMEKDIVKRRSRIKLPVEEIIADYERCVSLSDMGQKYGVSASTIYLRVKEYYKEKDMQTKKYRKKPKKQLPMIEEIVKDYQKGMLLEELSKKYRLSMYMISTRMKEYCSKEGIKLERHYGTKKFEPIDLEIKKEKKRMEIQQEIENTEKNETRKRVLKSVPIVVDYLKKGITPEQIQDLADKNGVIIPPDLMEKAIEICRNSEAQSKEDKER